MVYRGGYRNDLRWGAFPFYSVESPESDPETVISYKNLQKQVGMALHLLNPVSATEEKEALISLKSQKTMCLKVLESDSQDFKRSKMSPRVNHIDGSYKGL